MTERKPFAPTMMRTAKRDARLAFGQLWQRRMELGGITKVRGAGGRWR